MISIRGAMIVAVGLFAPLSAMAASGPGTCRYVHVVDPCQDDLLIFNAGEPYIRHNVPLDQSYVYGFDATGVAFATVPGYQSSFSFVTQGPFLRVIDHHLATPRYTIDVEFDLDIAGIELQGVAAAPGVGVGGDLEYALFLVGHRYLGWTVEPYYVVLDQEGLLAGAPILLAAGPLCVPGVSCRGTGLDIAASGPIGGATLQEAFASVVNVDADGTRRQRYYRVRRSSAEDWTVSLEPWNEEPVPFQGMAHRSIGLDYDSTGLLPFGVFQTTATVQNLLTGQTSCALPGDPTDVQVWGPGAGVLQPNYHFVTTRTGTTDLLLAFPTDRCVDGAPDTLAVPVGAYPRAVDLDSDSADEAWVYTANKDHGVSAIRVRLAGGPSGDTLQVVGQLDIPFAGCPIDLEFRDAVFTECDTFADQPHPAEPSPPDPECIDPLDPACIDPDGEPDCPPEGCQLRAPRR